AKRTSGRRLDARQLLNQVFLMMVNNHALTKVSGRSLSYALNALSIVSWTRSSASGEFLVTLTAYRCNSARSGATSWSNDPVKGGGAGRLAVMDSMVVVGGRDHLKISWRFHEARRPSIPLDVQPADSVS